MLRLLEVLKSEGGEANHLSIRENYHDMPTNGAVIDTATTYVGLGYAEIYEAGGRRMNVGSDFDYKKDYTIRLTPAGALLADALPPLPIDTPFETTFGKVIDKFDWNSSFWCGYSTTLTLISKVVDSIPIPQFRGFGLWGEPIDRVLALQAYEKARLIMYEPDSRGWWIHATEAGHKFGNAAIEAEKLAFKGHPIRRWNCRRALRNLEKV
ncbi:MAG: hypothetical protein P4M13_05510 [Alphaproteobacteria bacterium]|nr:hypothetical protein [Alphaproteobacteria bacterium]